MVLLTNISHSSDTSEHLITRLDDVIERALIEQRLVGAVVLVAHHGELIYHQAAGWADRDAQRPMQENTLFRLSSVSKPIVSTVAMILIAQGKLGLDQDIHHWLPDFKPSLQDGSRPVITVRQLLSHTAGLSYRFLEPDANGPYTRAGVSDGMDAADISLSENLSRLASVPLFYPPGLSWSYSLSVDVLGAVLEAVAQRPLPEVVKEALTGPLAMNDTLFFTSDRQRLATAYVSDTPAPHPLLEGETVPVFEETIGITYSPARIFNPQAFPSSGAGMVSSATDILRLLEMLRKGGGLRC